MKESNSENGNTLYCVLKNSLISLGISLFICVIAILLITGSAMTAEHPRSFLPFGRYIFLAGAAICSFICGKRVGKQGFLCGVVSGLLYNLSIFLLSLSVGGADGGIDLLFPLISLIISVITACFGCAGKGTVSGAPPSGIKKKKAVHFKNGYNK